MSVREKVEHYFEQHGDTGQEVEAIAAELDLAQSTVSFHVTRIRAGLAQLQKRAPVSHEEVRERWIGRARKRVDAGTAPDAVINQILLEHGPRLTLDEIGLRPAGEAAHRLLDQLSHGRKAGD